MNGMPGSAASPTAELLEMVFSTPAGILLVVLLLIILFRAVERPFPGYTVVRVEPLRDVGPRGSGCLPLLLLGLVIVLAISLM